MRLRKGSVVKIKADAISSRRGMHRKFIANKPYVVKSASGGYLLVMGERGGWTWIRKEHAIMMKANTISSKCKKCASTCKQKKPCPFFALDGGGII